jgi:hypothetical protein
VISLAISFSLTGLLISKFVSHAEKNPSVIYVVEKQVRVTDINFPAVSICPGIVLEREFFVDLNYDGIIRGLQNGSIKVEDLSDHE